MCGRYSFAPKPKQLEQALPDLEPVPAFKISFNIAPTHRAYVIVQGQQWQEMEWGLVPHWSKDGKNTGKLINARAEGIAEKPSFREPVLFRHCLVPADSFYEWRTEPGGHKAPYRILPQDGSLLFFAGIWDEWGHGTNARRTFSIITTTPNEEMATLHDRMPVLLTDAAARTTWLAAPNLEASLQLLHPPQNHLLRMYRISDKLNKPGYDAPDLQDEAPEPLLLF